MRILQDGNLRLRPARVPDDVDTAWPWYQNVDTLALSEGPGTGPMSRRRVEGMYRYLAEHGEFYMIEIRGGGGGEGAHEESWRPIGDVMLAPHTLPIVIGDPSCRRHGLGGRVRALLIARAREWGWPELRAKPIGVHNLASRRLFQAAGFVMDSTDVDEAGWAFERYRLNLRP